MRTSGTPAELERRRRLAVRRFHCGDTIQTIAAVLEVSDRSVQRWVAAGSSRSRALRARPVSGRPPKLDHTQTKIVRRWLAQSPLDLGFSTELWTSRRLVSLIEQTWEVSFHPHYFCDWLRKQGYSPQKPERVPRERNADAIRGWCRTEWPRLQKKRNANADTWFSSTKAAC